MNHFVDQLRTYRKESSELKRGKPPSQASDYELGTIAYCIGYCLLGSIIGAIALGFYEKSYFAAYAGFKWGALIAFLGYGLWPLLSWLFHLVRFGRLPFPDFGKKFLDGQKFLCVCLVGWFFVYTFNHEYFFVKSYLQENMFSQQKIASANLHKEPIRHEHQERYREVAYMNPSYFTKFLKVSA